MIKCKECINISGSSKKFNKITWSHLRKKHDMTRDEYKEKYPNSKLISDETRDSYSWTKEKAIEKYGKKKGLKKWNEYKQRQSYTNTFEYKKKKYGWTKEEFDEYNKSRAVTKENLIDKYGKEKGLKKWNEYIEKQKYSGSCEEYFIEKYGKNEGKRIWKKICNDKRNTLENFIKRSDWNIAKGLKKYDEYMNNIAQNYGQSEIANELFDFVYKELKNRYSSDNIYYDNHEKNNEWILNIEDYGVITVDFFVKGTGKVIEFFGDFWHGNPNLYKYNEKINRPGKIISACKIWENDKERIEKMLKIPYINNVKIIWEKDYRKDKSEIRKECINFICKNQR